MKKIITVAFLAGCLSLNAFKPNDPYFNFEYDPAHPENIGQWYLHNTLPETVQGVHNAGLDINVLPVWEKGITGEGVVIGIVDDGIQSNHPDMAPNYRADLSKAFHEHPIIQQYPVGTFLPRKSHGTAVAGVAAAKGGNGIGITGVAPDAYVSDLQIFSKEESSKENGMCLPNDKAIMEEAVLKDELEAGGNTLEAFEWATGVLETEEEDGCKYLGESRIHIQNFSRGIPLGSLLDDLASFFEEYEEEDGDEDNCDANLNNVIQVHASGNGGSNLMDTFMAFSFPIVVGGMGLDGKKASFSDYGSMLFVTAPAGISNKDACCVIAPILTTDRTHFMMGYNTKICPPIDLNHFRRLINNDQMKSIDAAILCLYGENTGFQDSHYVAASGTSLSAPIVSGVMALGKQINPLMSMRLAKHALVQSSRKVDQESPYWVTNAANNTFNPFYGFGLIDAAAFGEKIESLAYVTTEKAVETETVKNLSLDFNNGPVIIPFNLNFKDEENQFSSLPLEDMQFCLCFSSALMNNHGDIIIESPQGTRSILVYESDNVATKNLFLISNAFWGELSEGEWKLIFSNKESGSPLDPFTLKIFKAGASFGKAVEESPSMVIDNALEAESIVLKQPDTHLHIQSEAHVTLKDGILLNEGTIQLDGTVDQTDFKGNRITLNGGLLTGSGTIYAKRSVENDSGEFVPNNITILGSYAQGPHGTMTLHLNDEGKALLTVTDNTLLEGELKIITKNRMQKLKVGDSIDLIEAGDFFGRFRNIFVDNQDEGYVYHLHHTKDKLALTVIQDKEQCINSDLLDSHKSNNFLDTLNSKFGSPSYKPVLVNQKKITLKDHTFKVYLQNPARPHSPPFPYGIEWKEPACIGFADEATEIIILDENNNTVATAPINDNCPIEVIGELYGEPYAFTVETHLDHSKDIFSVIIEGQAL